MAFFSIVKCLRKRIAVKKRYLSNITSKIYKTAGSIGFIKKPLYHEIRPKFAQVQGNFINKNDKYKAQKSILLSHLNDHVCSLKILCKIHYCLCTELKQLTGKFLYLIITNHINILQYKEQLSSIKTKNKKLKKLIQNYTPTSKYKVTITNLSNY